MKSLSEANGSSTIRVRGNGEQPTSDDGGHNGKQLFHVFSCALASPHVPFNAATSHAHTAGRRPTPHPTHPTDTCTHPSPASSVRASPTSTPRSWCCSWDPPAPASRRC